MRACARALFGKGQSSARDWQLAGASSNQRPRRGESRLLLADGSVGKNVEKVSHE